ncbi:MAG: hypothetical protein LUC16_01495 [Coprobacillus sp.]|nr:hypothetical protein [Coprobacillus sp.]
MARKTSYTTYQGQTWDQIAFDVYGDEIYADYVMENNYDYLDVLVFSGGEVLYVPPLPESLEGTMPPWRNSTTSSGIDPYDV